MPQSPRARAVDGSSGKRGARRADSRTVDLGLSLAVYQKNEDGSLVEIGDASSPLSRQRTTGTWPTEQ